MPPHGPSGTPKADQDVHAKHPTGLEQFGLSPEALELLGEPDTPAPSSLEVQAVNTVPQTPFATPPAPAAAGNEGDQKTRGEKAETPQAPIGDDEAQRATFAPPEPPAQAHELPPLPPPTVLAAQPPVRPTPRWPWAAGALGAVALTIFGVWALRPGTRPPEVVVTAQTASSPPPVVQPVSQPAAPTPSATATADALPQAKVGPSVLPTPAAKAPAAPSQTLLPLDAAHVDALDYASLKAGIAQGAGPASSGLLAWANFRLAYAFADPQAQQSLKSAWAAAHQTFKKTRLKQPLGDPWAEAAAVGAGVLVAPPHEVLPLLRALESRGSVSPQLQVVRALFDSHTSRGLEGRARTELAGVVSTHPSLVDGALLLAEAELKGDEERSAIETLSHLALTGVPDTLARASALLWHAQAFAALKTTLGHRLLDHTSAALLEEWQSAAPQHQSILRQLALRHRLWQGAMTDALEFAQAEARAWPDAPRAQWDLCRLTHLLGLSEGSGPERTLLAVSPPMTQARLGLWAVDWGTRRQAPEFIAAGQKALSQWGPEAESWRSLALARLGHPETERVKTRGQSVRRRTPGDDVMAPWWAGLGPAESLGAPAARLLALEGALVRLDKPPQLAKKSVRARPSSGRKNRLAPVLQKPEVTTLVMPREDVLTWLNLSLLGAAEAARRPARAARAAEALLWLDPLCDDPIVLIMAWARNSAQARLNSAIEQKDKALFETPGAVALFSLAQTRPQDDRPLLAVRDMGQVWGDFDVVQRALSTLLLRHPDDAALTRQLAEALIAAHKSDLAREQLEALAKKRPEVRDADYLYVYARTLEETDPARAIAALSTAISKGAPPRALVFKAKLQAAHGQRDAALAELLEATTQAPQEPSYTLAYAAMLMENEAFQQACDRLENTLKSPHLAAADRAHLFEMLGDARREMQQSPRALAAYLTALSELPTSDLMLKTARLELRDLGHTQSAQRRLRALCEREPERAEAFYLLGLAERDMGHKQAAFAAFHRYLKLAPQGEAATEVRELLAP